MNGDCRPRGRDEWPGTRGGNGGETRARRTFLHERGRTLRIPRRERERERERERGRGREREGEGRGHGARGRGPCFARIITVNSSGR